MRISDWSSDVCSSALVPEQRIVFHQEKPLVRAPPNTVARPEVFVSAVFFGGLCSAAVYPLYRGKSISRKTGPRTRGITPHSHRKPMSLPRNPIVIVPARLASTRLPGTIGRPTGRERVCQYV